MSDAELFRPQPETSNMPSVLASVISLALHGLLWVVPPISMSRQKSDTQRTVGLVQLTPEEIGRIQEFSDSAVSLPPLPSTLPSTDVLPPPLQQPSTQSLQQQEELVRQQIVQRQQRLLQNKLQQQEELLRQQMRRQDELIQKQKLQQQEALRRQIEQERQRQTETLRRELAQENQRIAQLREQEQQNQADKRQRQQEQQKQRQERVQREREVEDSDVLYELEKQEKEFIAPLKKQLQRQQKLEAFKRMYPYDSSGTTAREGTERLNNWWQEKTTQFSGIYPKLKEDRVVKSRAQVQLENITQASVAMLVNPEGKPEGEPELIGSTGYAVLNQAVIDDAKKLSFERTGKHEIYMYRVNINQEDLPPL